MIAISSCLYLLTVALYLMRKLNAAEDPNLDKFNKHKRALFARFRFILFYFIFNLNQLRDYFQLT